MEASNQWGLCDPNDDVEDTWLGILWRYSLSEERYSNDGTCFFFRVAGSIL